MFRNTLNVGRVIVASLFVLRIPGLLIILGLSFLRVPDAGAREDSADLYTGSGMVLQLSREKGNASRVKGVMYSREAAYKFEARRRGAGFRSTKLYARNDRLAPYREVEGALELQFRDGYEKVTLEMSSPLRSVSAVFRLQMDARAFNLLGQYGDSYCDLNHLVLLVVDRPKGASGGWLSRVMDDDADLMPVIGLFFGPRVWYSFQAEGDPGAGMTSSSLVVGDGALEGYLGTATLKARLEGNRLLYTYSDAGGTTSLQFPYRTQDKLCSRVVTRWTTRRRMPRGRVAEPEPVAKKPVQSARPPAGEKAEEKKPKAAEEETPRDEKAPVQAVTAPVSEAPEPRAEKETPGERRVRKAPAGEEVAEPEPAPVEEPQLKEGDETVPPEDMQYEDIPPETPGQELLPEEYEPLPGEDYPDSEGDLYQPVPGEENPEYPLYNEPLEELPPGEQFLEPDQ